jgi:anti-sigma factor RsiW
MSCSPFDLKDYFFGELAEPERGQVETHLAGCPACREEMGGLDLTRAALRCLPDEEPPRRIAFVSDKVFEPKWWQRIWSSGSQLGFAAAAMLAVAIVAHGYMMRPVAPVVQTSASVVETEVTKRVAAEVAKAVAASEDRQTARTLELVNARLRDAKTEQREILLTVRDHLERLAKKNATFISRTAYDQ